MLTPKSDPGVNRAYLGDAVYVEHGGLDSLVLTTDNGMGPNNTIHLDFNVYKALVRYVDQHYPAWKGGRA